MDPPVVITIPSFFFSHKAAYTKSSPISVEFFAIIIFLFLLLIERTNDHSVNAKIINQLPGDYGVFD